MDKAEWHRCTSTARMLDFLDGRPSDAVLRKFACACCRRIWDLIDSDLHRRAVEVAERFADGPGQEIVWVGSGGLATRGLARPMSEVPGTEEWASMLAELDAERAALNEQEYYFRYDHLTPVDAAAWTLYVRWDMPWVVSRGAAWLRAAPYPFWRACQEPQLSPGDEAEWEARERAESGAQCDLLRSLVEYPGRAEPS